MNTLRKLPETASEFGAEAKNSFEEFGRTAAQKLEEARVDTAGALHSAASSVRETGRKGSEAIDNLSTNAADRLDASASFVESCDAKSVLADARTFGSRHLAGSLVAAAAVGFIAGSAFYRAASSFARPRIG